MTTCAPSSPVNTYLLGQAIQVRARLRNAAGDYVAPTGLRLLVAGPGDSVSTEMPLTVTEGFATGAFTPDRAGLWRYRVESADPTAAAERVVRVNDRTVPPPA